MDELLIMINRSGDRGRAMYPLDVSVDGGALYDGQPADAQSVYHCWGWPMSECPFSFMVRA